jgi:hypothetical protein
MLMPGESIFYLFLLLSKEIRIETLDKQTKVHAKYIYVYLFVGSGKMP